MAVLDRVPVDEISAEAREVHVGRVILTVLAAILFAVGWLGGALVSAVAWSAVAVKVGYREGRRRSVAETG